MIAWVNCIIEWIYGLLYLIYDYVTDDRLNHVFEVEIHKLGKQFRIAAFVYFLRKMEKYSSRANKKTYNAYTGHYGYHEIPFRRFEYKGLDILYKYKRVDRFFVQIMLEIKTYKSRSDVVDIISKCGLKLNKKIGVEKDKEAEINLSKMGIYD
jgi:hypothetical protein